ncbi:MAG: hypothetical protein AAF411_02365 [Myxococcota bacterium]
MNGFIPTAAWCWPGEEPSAEPALGSARTRATVTEQELRAILARFTDILGPLRHEPAIVRPLSLHGGRLIACELLAIPTAPDWPRWLADIEHVQTTSPEVCRALRTTARSFTVMGEDCMDALAGVSAVDAAGPGGFPTTDWCERPRLDAEAFMPIVRLAFRTWWCWDRDHDRMALVSTDDPKHALGDTFQVLNPALSVVGPLPVRRDHPPHTPLSHAGAAGTGWGCGVHVSRLPQALVAVRSGAAALFSPLNSKIGDHGEAIAERFIHAPQRAFDADPERQLGSLAAVFFEGDRLRVRWAGAHQLYRLRSGALAQLTQPHTLAQEWTAAGRDLATCPMPDALTKCLGAAPDEANFDLLPSDRLLLITRSAAELFDDAALVRLLAGDARRSAAHVEHALQRAKKTDACLFFGGDACFEHRHPGWYLTPNVELGDPGPSLYPVRTSEEPFDAFTQPQRWSILRAAPVAPADPWPQPEHWHQSLREALERYAHQTGYTPERDDVLHAYTAEGRLIALRFDGGWQATRPLRHRTAERVASGRLRFAEDRPTPRLEASIKQAETTPTRATEVEALAREEGFDSLAFWLNQERRRVEGGSGVGLERARELVSLLVRRRLRALIYSDHPVAHAVDVRALARAPRDFHQCRVRYRSWVQTAFEACSSAGAWWRPVGGHANGEDSAQLAEVDATWQANAIGLAGYGHFGMSQALAVGTHAPYVAPPSPRRIRPEQLRYVRIGVPVRVKLTIERTTLGWCWPDGQRRYEVQFASGDQVANTLGDGVVELDAVVMRVEVLVVLEVKAVS